MIMVSQDHPEPGQEAAERSMAGKEGTGWRGSSRSRRATMPPTRGGRSAPLTAHPKPAARPPATTWPRQTRAASPQAGGRAPGSADLGFRDGQIIEREVFERLYGKFLDPRDPLARRGWDGRHSGSVAEKESSRAARAGAGSHRRTPRPANDRGEVAGPGPGAVLRRDVQRVESRSRYCMRRPWPTPPGRRPWGTWRRSRTGSRPPRTCGRACRPVTRGAGVPAARGGIHAVGVSRPTGRAGADRPVGGRARFIVGSFAQHTSRDGDPQLHIHNLILNRVQRESDGVYRTLDSRSLHEHRGAAAAIATVVMESRAVPGVRDRLGRAGRRARPGGPRGERGSDGGVLLTAAEHLGPDRPARGRVPGPARAMRRTHGRSAICASGPTTRAGSASR